MCTEEFINFVSFNILYVSSHSIYYHYCVPCDRLGVQGDVQGWTAIINGI